jgi:hypothetical protein
MLTFKARYIVLTGLCLLIGGFVYEAIFNGLPYPDPTPEMSAQWALNETVASIFYRAGLLVIAAGMAWGLYSKLKR